MSLRIILFIFILITYLNKNLSNIVWGEYKYIYIMLKITKTIKMLRL